MHLQSQQIKDGGAYALCLVIDCIRSDTTDVGFAANALCVETLHRKMR